MRWVTGLGAGEVSAGGNTQALSAAALEACSCPRCPHQACRKPMGPAQLQSPSLSPASGSSPFASPTAISEALARLLPWERSSIPSRCFSSLFLAQERSAYPSRQVGKPVIPSAEPSEGYCCLLRASRRLPSPAGLLKESGAFMLPGEQEKSTKNVALAWPTICTHCSSHAQHCCQGGLGQQGLTLHSSQQGWPRSWCPPGGKRGQQAPGAPGLSPRPTPPLTSPPAQGKGFSLLPICALQL